MTGATRMRIGALLAGALVMVGLVRAPAPASAAPIFPPAPAAPGILAPGTTGLTLDLAAAYTVARQEAARSGVQLSITSGKRTRAEQAALWRAGLAQYGSPEAARRWVLPPGRSTHETGEAIDVGPRAGARWLERYGARWGLCRTYDNEWWHFERVVVPGARCPGRLPDASHR